MSASTSGAPSVPHVPAAAKSSSTQSDARLVLTIARTHVGLYPAPPPRITTNNDVDTMMTVSQPLPGGDPLLRLLSGRVADLILYARHEHSSWLLDMGHDICDPRDKRGWLLVEDPISRQWSPVQALDPLIPAIYRYVLPPNTLVRLSKVSKRSGKSKTSATGSASNMRGGTIGRDRNTCWISGPVDATFLTNSHVCPKRMGNLLARFILVEFCGWDPSPAVTTATTATTTTATAGTSTITATTTTTPPTPPTPAPSAAQRRIYDTIFGLALQKLHDQIFDQYEMGFRHVVGESYTAHIFILNLVATYTTLGPFPGNGLPLLHGRTITPPDPGNANNPPPGLFRWHYLQCVIKLFGDNEYKNLPNIEYAEVPMRMVGDSDEEGTDDEADWPSAAWDRGRLAYEDEQETVQRQRNVSDWIASH